VERVPTVFFGSGSFALPAFARLTGPGAGARLVDVVAVVTAPPRPAGRRGELQATPVAAAAQERGIAVLTPASLRSDAVLEELRGLAGHLIVLADYGRLIPAAVLAMPAYGALNLHPSLLPRHRGASPVPAAILAGDARTGVTLMRMDEGLDSGPILAQRQVPLGGRETAPGLEARLAEVAADLLVESLPAWLAGTLVARAQSEEGMTLTRPLRRADGRLDPLRPAEELERQVRALQPWPGSFLELEGSRLIVWRAAVLAEAGDGDGGSGDMRGSDDDAERQRGDVDRDIGGDMHGHIGALVPVADTLALRTSRGTLRLDEVQPAGGRRMSGAEYRRGRRA
jgi:methionyl-tRNA formyltransferase